MRSGENGPLEMAINYQFAGSVCYWPLLGAGARPLNRLEDLNRRRLKKIKPLFSSAWRLVPIPTMRRLDRNEAEAASPSSASSSGSKSRAMELMPSPLNGSSLGTRVAGWSFLAQRL